MPRVFNLHGTPDGAVYIGRPSKWGNPFVIGRDGTRAEVIAKYRAWLGSQPAPCHGDVLLELANAGPERLSDQRQTIGPCPHCRETE